MQKSPQEEERTEAWSSIESQGEEGRAAGGGGSGFKTIFTSTSIPSKAEVRPEFHAKTARPIVPIAMSNLISVV